MNELVSRRPPAASTDVRWSNDTVSMLMSMLPRRCDCDPEQTPTLTMRARC